MTPAELARIRERAKLDDADGDLRALMQEVDRLHKVAGELASGWLRMLMDQRLEDGTLVMEIVLRENPELRERLLAVLS